MKDHVQNVVKGSGKETAHHAKIVVGNVLDVGVTEAFFRKGFHVVHDVVIVI